MGAAPPTRSARACAAVFLALPVLPLLLALGGCGKDEDRPVSVPGGDAALGKKLVGQYQCGACHYIPDVPGAAGTAGPRLDKFGHALYFAGGVPNAPDALVAWIVDPPAMKPGTGMPNLGVSRDEARHIAAYLYAQR